MPRKPTFLEWESDDEIDKIDDELDFEIKIPSFKLPDLDELD